MRSLHPLSLTLLVLVASCATAPNPAPRPTLEALATPADRPPVIAPHDPALDRYLAFLQQPLSSPVDYALRLFETYDIVILCERFHAETTQYDLIYDIIRDPRFVEHVGRVFLETGGRAVAPEIRSLLHGPQLSDEQVQTRIGEIARHFSWSFSWNKLNVFDLIRRVYELDLGLVDPQKVDLIPVDLDFPWQTDSYREWEQWMARERDREMANEIAARFDEILRTADPRRKALVIMNYRHAFGDLRFDNGRRSDSVGRFLFERYPGRVANVLINSIAIKAAEGRQVTAVALIQGGKWDAAFAATNDRAVGFDFRGAPFGADQFDYFPLQTKTVRYEDVFTGFIFYQPVSAHEQVFGLEKYADRTWIEEMRRRYAKAGWDPAMKDEFISQQMDEMLHEKRVKYPELPEFERQIRRWLGAAQQGASSGAEAGPRSP